MERLGPNHSPASRFRICLPRSWTFWELTQRYISTLSPEAALDARIRECHPRQALELLGSCEAEIAVIRYAVEYQPYFEEQCSSKKLRLTPLDQVEYSLVLSRDDPLSRKQESAGKLHRAAAPGCISSRHEGQAQPYHRRPAGTAAASANPSPEFYLVRASAPFASANRRSGAAPLSGRRTAVPQCPGVQPSVRHVRDGTGFLPMVAHGQRPDHTIIPFACHIAVLRLFFLLFERILVS